jgi:8-oxo-dGTP diphosphatase
MADAVINSRDYVHVAVVYFCHNGVYPYGQFVMSLRGQNCRDEHGKWDIGGGEVEPGDSVEETLRKELKEEYGAEPRNILFLGYREAVNTCNGQEVQWVYLDFKVEVDPATVKNGEPHKFDDVRWFTEKELPPVDRLHAGMPGFLKKYHGKIFPRDTEHDSPGCL